MPDPFPTMYSDNIGAMYLCVNLVFHSSMKHLAIDYHFVRDLVANKQLRVSHVLSNHQHVDLLTKALASSHHKFLIDKIGVVSATTILQKHIGLLT